VAEDEGRGLVAAWHGLSQTHLEHTAGAVLTHPVKGHQNGAHGGTKDHTE